MACEDREQQLALRRDRSLHSEEDEGSDGFDCLLSGGQQLWREGEGSGWGQVKLLPAPQLLLETGCQYTLDSLVDGPCEQRDDQDHSNGSSAGHHN